MKSMRFIKSKEFKKLHWIESSKLYWIHPKSTKLQKTIFPICIFLKKKPPDRIIAVISHHYRPLFLALVSFLIAFQSVIFLPYHSSCAYTIIFSWRHSISLSNNVGVLSDCTSSSFGIIRHHSASWWGIMMRPEWNFTLWCNYQCETTLFPNVTVIELKQCITPLTKLGELEKWSI